MLPANVRKTICYIWASPATCLGLFSLLCAVVSGGSVRIVNGVMEVHGGLVSRFLKVGTPWLKTISAMTLGHVVLGLNDETLEYTRDHERIHVGQYEKWGPFFIPLYFISSALAYMRGQDPYRDNAFEKEAYRRSND
jgi:hypothetical protein